MNTVSIDAYLECSTRRMKKQSISFSEAWNHDVCHSSAILQLSFAVHARSPARCSSCRIDFTRSVHASATILFLARKLPGFHAFVGFLVTRIRSMIRDILILFVVVIHLVGLARSITGFLRMRWIRIRRTRVTHSVSSYFPFLLIGLMLFHFVKSRDIHVSSVRNCDLLTINFRRSHQENLGRWDSCKMGALKMRTRGLKFSQRD